MALLSSPLSTKPQWASPSAAPTPTSAPHRGCALRTVAGGVHRRCAKGTQSQPSLPSIPSRAGALSLSLSFSLSLQGTGAGPRPKQRGAVCRREARRRDGPTPAAVSNSVSGSFPVSGLGLGSLSVSDVRSGTVLRRLRARIARRAGQGAGGAGGGGSEEFPQVAFEQRDPDGGGVQRAKGAADALRIGFFVTVLGLATALQVALEGRLGGFVDGTLGVIVQLLFALTALDVSLTSAAWLLSLFSKSSGLAQCPWCTARFKFNRQEAERFFLHTLVNGPESGAAACPSCGGELVFTGLETEPLFTRRPGAEAPLGVAFKKGRWDPEGNGKVVDIEATVYNKD